MAELSAYRFSAPLLTDRIGDSHPARYLAGYLEDLGVSSVLEEPDYVDRHFLDDFAEYYARSFVPLSPRCARLHFFRRLSPDELRSTFAGACTGVAARESAEADLNRDYLGFVVVRPLPSARMGRTVLATYPPVGERHYEVVRSYHVHVAAIRLTVRGLAFQQQDRGAAVCASTALWSALQMVAMAAGQRTPSPSAITRAAATPFASSHGLTDEQMAGAIAALGYAADTFSPHGNPLLFRAKLVACLRSKLPVILLLTRKQDTGAGEVPVGHAVTVTGYRESEHVFNVPAGQRGMRAIPMRSASTEVLYVHDDNLGFHAHYELCIEERSDGARATRLLRGRSKGPPIERWVPDRWDVYSALVPKPGKLRLPVEELFASLLILRPLLEKVFEGLSLDYDVCFSTGVDYSREMFESRFGPPELAAFLWSVQLPRHVAIITVRSKSSGTLLCDVVIDATEIQRDETRPTILCVVAPGVPRDSIAGSRLSAVAAILNIRFIALPAPTT